MPNGIDYDKLFVERNLGPPSYYFLAIPNAEINSIIHQDYHNWILSQIQP